MVSVILCALVSEFVLAVQDACPIYPWAVRSTAVESSARGGFWGCQLACVCLSPQDQQSPGWGGLIVGR